MGDFPVPSLKNKLLGAARAATALSWAGGATAGSAPTLVMEGAEPGQASGPGTDAAFHHLSERICSILLSIDALSQKWHQKNAHAQESVKEETNPQSSSLEPLPDILEQHPLCCHLGRNPPTTGSAQAHGMNAGGHYKQPHLLQPLVRHETTQTPGLASSTISSHSRGLIS